MSNIKSHIEWIETKIAPFVKTNNSTDNSTDNSIKLVAHPNDIGDAEFLSKFYLSIKLKNSLSNIVPEKLFNTITLHYNDVKSTLTSKFALTLSYINSTPEVHKCLDKMLYAEQIYFPIPFCPSDKLLLAKQQNIWLELNMNTESNTESNTEFSEKNNYNMMDNIETIELLYDVIKLNSQFNFNEYRNKFQIYLCVSVDMGTFSKLTLDKFGNEIMKCNFDVKIDSNDNVSDEILLQNMMWFYVPKANLNQTDSIDPIDSIEFKILDYADDTRSVLYPHSTSPVYYNKVQQSIHYDSHFDGLHTYSFVIRPTYFNDEEGVMLNRYNNAINFDQIITRDISPDDYIQQVCVKSVVDIKLNKIEHNP